MKYLFIVEGPSDAVIYETILSALIDTNVSVVVTKGDITSKTDLPYFMLKGTELIEEFIKKELSNSEILGLSKVIFITDTDGCYIPNENIKSSSDVQFNIYQANCIISRSCADLVNRNKRKSLNLNLIYKAKTVLDDVPLESYYNSCNLDHVYFNERNLSDDLKIHYARNFANKLADSLTDYVLFISSDKLCPYKEYYKSWEYIKSRTNSLLRRTNFYSFLLRNFEILNDSVKSIIKNINNTEYKFNKVRRMNNEGIDKSDV